MGITIRPPEYAGLKECSVMISLTWEERRDILSLSHSKCAETC